MAAVTASVATGGAAIACALYIFLAGIGEIDRNAVLMIAVFALLGSASAWLAHQHGHSIAPPALLFATCLVVGGLLLYWTNVADPELRPAAVLRADGSVLAGAWIARNDDWFFLGRLSAEEGAGGRLIAVPADSIEGFSIDAYRSPDEVEERSSELAAVLRCDLTRTNC